MNGIDYGRGVTNIDLATGIRYGVISLNSLAGDALDNLESVGFHFEDSEYTLVDCLDSDLMVIESPYYTFAQFCSPCVPGAGNLDNFELEGAKTYCLGPEWFDEYNPRPYKVYRVSDCTEVVD